MFITKYTTIQTRISIYAQPKTAILQRRNNSKITLGPKRWNFKKIPSYKFCPYKVIDTPSMVTYKLQDFSSKQITLHGSDSVPYYPQELLVQVKKQKYFSDNTFQLLHPQKLTIAKRKSVSFSLDTLSIPSRLDELSLQPSILRKLHYQKRSFTKTTEKRQWSLYSTVKEFGLTNVAPIKHIPAQKYTKFNTSLCLAENN